MNIEGKADAQRLRQNTEMGTTNLCVRERTHGKEGEEKQGRRTESLVSWAYAV